jgi:hypothetical protein
VQVGREQSCGFDAVIAAQELIGVNAPAGPWCLLG